MLRGKAHAQVNQNQHSDDAGGIASGRGEREKVSRVVFGDRISANASGALCAKTIATMAPPGTSAMTRPVRALITGRRWHCRVREQSAALLRIALWNGNDPILKERLFGLTNSEGNHGEDVKEYYFYLDSSPTHSYMKYLYKYPQRRISLMADLIKTNRQRGRNRRGIRIDRHRNVQ